jgi:hypothetical protein
LLDSLPTAISRFFQEEADVQRQRECHPRRTEESNLTIEDTETVCQSILTTADDNHYNASYFISAAYHANFCFTGLQDYRKALEICEEGLASLKSLRNVFSLNTFEANFSNEILCMFINRQYIDIFDSGIQVLFGFLTLYMTTVRQNEMAALDPSLFDRDLDIQVCAGEFLEYIRIRCRNKLQLSKGDCLDNTRLFYDAHKEIYVVLRRLSIAMLSAALRVDYTHYANTSSKL